ncbi:hypothetical protein LSCM1_07785 [Leishmania martiniquensis]|uniref:Phosphatidylinositol 4-phosphate 5-kinase n=1 Tax=Leishmania martiniquensis TaxID=1580590 RepID=A0A836HT51_9TRYP|nr:hypothetical protein LSCM1_07785 [Leishmania martiniquensis]
MSDSGSEAAVELPQMWQFIHPMFNRADSDEEESNDEEDVDVAGHDAARGGRPADYVRLKKSAPHVGQLIRFLNDMDEEDVQGVLLEKDPVTRQTLLQWATLNNHFMLVEYLVKRMKRAAFSFDADSVEVVVYDRWVEMLPELPSVAEVAERQKQRESEKAKRLAERAMANGGDVDENEDEESEEEEVEPMPEELVYDTLEEYHSEWGDGGVGVVKRIGELGVYVGPRLQDGTKQGLGQTLFPSGDCYTGEYKENQRDGRGVYWWSKSGALYCGEWFRNTRHGYGRMVYPDGSRYLGCWVRGKRSGKGRYVYADASSYDGNWVKDEKHGSGTYHLLDGSSFIGSFDHNRFVSGEWRLASGTVRYIGNFEKDVPAGAGVYVHRCGLKAGTFQQEGTYSEEGKVWVPGVLRGTSRMVPHIELVVPPQPSGLTRVPMEFAAECTGYTMGDLIKAANFAPLLRWVASLASTADDAVPNEAELRGVEVQSMRYDAADPDAITEVTILPILVDRVGKRVHLPWELVTLKPSVTRLMILLETPGMQPVVVLEKSLQSASPDEQHQQSRLPAVHISEDSSVDGDVVDIIGSALRLQLTSTKFMAPLLPPMRCNPTLSNAEESVWMYAQEVHHEAMAQLEHKLLQLSTESPGASTTYVAVPLSDVTATSTDAMTAMAAANVQQRRAAQTLPSATVAPQRPPTPPPPMLEPRPELQPLYDAKARREEAELED